MLVLGKINWQRMHQDTNLSALSYLEWSNNISENLPHKIPPKLRTRSIIALLGLRKRF
jgi:hypothetical protein